MPPLSAARNPVSSVIRGPRLSSEACFRRPRASDSARCAKSAMISSKNSRSAGRIRLCQPGSMSTRSLPGFFKSSKTAWSVCDSPSAPRDGLYARAQNRMGRFSSTVGEKGFTCSQLMALDHRVQCFFQGCCVRQPVEASRKILDGGPSLPLIRDGGESPPDLLHVEIIENRPKCQQKSECDRRVNALVPVPGC